jgi:hypothetical protein
MLSGAFLMWFYYATPMVFLPVHWTQWMHGILAFPFSPPGPFFGYLQADFFEIGSVSLNVWLLLCRRACKRIL